MINPGMWNANYHMAPRVIADTLGAHVDLAGCTLVDFGCGLGVKTLGLAAHYGPKRVVGVDLRQEWTGLAEAAHEHAGLDALPRCLSFMTIAPGQPLEKLVRPDCIASWSVFEHLPRDLIAGILADHYRALTVPGLMFIQINPLFYSPFGHHLGSVIEQPWQHLLLDEQGLRNKLFSAERVIGHTGIKAALASGKPVSERMKHDLWRCYQSLNRLEVSELIELASAAGFRLLSRKTGHSKLVPPDELLARYSADVLTTEGVQLLFAKSRPSVRERLRAPLRRLLRYSR
jgi:hypothetical protein